MIVITVTDTPPKVRGDLSKWLLEINTGVYVGNVSSRVREELWERVCANLKNGRATMVYNSQGEQRMDFRVHNSAWEPVDYDGIKLIRHPAAVNKEKKDNLTKKGFSKAAKGVYARKGGTVRSTKDDKRYIVFDIETTGLSYTEDQIIEVAALRVRNGEVQEEYSELIECELPLSKDIVQLTGITEELLSQKGKPLTTALEHLIDFFHGETLVCYNAAFDMGFLQAACQQSKITLPENFKIIDSLKLSRRKIRKIADYKLTTLGEYFNLDTSGAHRALKDCYLTYEVYEKLNE